MKQSIFITAFIVFSFSCSIINAQVGINNDNTDPDASAMLHVKSTDKGLLVPRMTSTNRTNINTPANGLLVFDTTTGSFWFFNNTAWAELKGGTSNGVADADNDTKIQVEETADEDKIRFDISGTERWVMDGTRLESVNTGNSVFIGAGAGANDNLNNNRNTFIGNLAGNSNTSGPLNVAVGAESLSANTTGAGNVSLGYKALASNTTGNINVATGNEALTANTTGNFNVASGSKALSENTSGSQNVATGSNALRANTTGNNNVAIGNSVLGLNITGDGNTAIGSSSLHQNSAGSTNVAVGVSALFSNTTGSNNVASGSEALSFNNTGHSNAATGNQSLYSNTTGFYNSAIGFQALYNNTTGSENIASGYLTMGNNTTGIRNTAIGTKALQGNSIGDNNTAIGFNANVSTPNLTNATAIGANAEVTASNSIQLGDANVTNVTTAGGLTIGGAEVFMQNLPTLGSGGTPVVIGNNGQLWKQASSRRFKDNIEPFEDDYDLLLETEMKWWTAKGEDATGERDYGYIAEEVDTLGLSHLVHHDKNGEIDGFKSRVMWYYGIELIKKHRKMIVELESQLANGQAKNKILQSELSAVQNELEEIKELKKQMADLSAVQADLKVYLADREAMLQSTTSNASLHSGK